MVTAAASALGRNANAAQGGPDAPARRLNLRQEMLVREFTSHYDIRPDQIFFDANSDEPYFDFEALSLLVNELADLPRISVRPLSNDSTTSLADALCEITLHNGYTREYTGSAFLGEVMPGGGRVGDWRQAQSVAQVRALRKALRAVSFDPVRAHEAKKHGVDLDLRLDDPRARELREAHKLGTELGYIVGDDKSVWKQEIKTFTRDEFDSMELMDDKTRGHWLIHLRALQRNGLARQQLASSEPES